jgi:transposase
MLATKYVVDHTEEERQQLLQLIRKGKPGARKVARANILLLTDEDRTDAQVAEALHVGIATVGPIRKRFVEEGLASALTERPRPGQQPKLTGK